MRNITHALQEIIQENSLIQFGLSYQLLNLSQLAKFLKPLIEARTQKEVQVTAITMNLSRLQRKMSKIAQPPEKFQAENIVIYSNLATMTFHKSPEMHRYIQRFYTKIQEQNGYITLTEGSHEITIIFENTFHELSQKFILEKPRYENHEVASIGIRFPKKYTHTPGFIHSVIQQITLQGINIIELSSTFTELILYIEKKDIQLAFETVFHSFSKQ